MRPRRLLNPLHPAIPSPHTPSLPPLAPHRYCDVCEPKWYKAQDKLCYDCAAADGNVGANVGLAVGLFLGVFVIILGFLCKGRKAAIAELLAGDVSEEGIESAVESKADKAGETRTSIPFSIRLLRARVRAKIYMSLIQVLSSIGTVFEIAFPPIFSGMMKWVGVLQLDIFSALPLDCVMTSSFHTTLLMRTLIPLGIMGALGAWGAWLLRKGDTSTTKGASRVWLGNVLYNLVFIILLCARRPRSLDLWASVLPRFCEAATFSFPLGLAC